ncbi:hypothetical protein [Actinoplanes sp. NPDC049681]|uniref:hypothetical protein n=1 Tax=Actinoplanes sp. NPDC049681 TaxID=3363905 RepID=UPI00379BB8A4
MSIWDELSREECVVLTNALEESWLNQVIGDYLGHREDGGIWSFSTDADAVRPLIPRFAVVVRDMIDRGLVELVATDRYRDLPDVPSMTEAEVETALTDPATWLPAAGEGPIMLIPTDQAVELVRR